MKTYNRWTLWLVRWSEHEFGVRDDGPTLHVSLENAQGHIKRVGGMGSCARPDGPPEEIEVTESLYEMVQTSPSGMMGFDKNSCLVPRTIYSYEAPKPPTVREPLYDQYTGELLKPGPKNP